MLGWNAKPFCACPFALHRRRDSVLLSLVALATMIGAAPRLHAQTEAQRQHAEARQLAETYVSDFTRLAEIEAREKTKSRSAAELAGGGLESLDLKTLTGFRALTPERRRLVATMLVDNVRPAIERTLESTAVVRDRTGVIARHWTDVRAARNEAELAKAQLLASKAVAGKLASLVSLDNRWFWLSTVCVVAVLAAASWHDRRHESRRRLLGAKARAMGVARWLRYLLILLVVMTLTTFLLGDRIFDLLTRVGGGGDAPSLATLQEQVAAQAKLLAEAAAGNSNRNNSPGAAAGDDPESQLAHLWQVARHEAHETMVSLQVQQRLLESLQQDEEQLKKLQDEAAANQAQIAEFQRSKRWIRAGMGGGMLTIVGGTALVFLRGIRRRRKLTENTCPMCMAVGKLEPVTEGAGAGQMVRCGNVLSDNPYEECHFTFHSVYRDMTKMCFPTLGHPSSGKTHWLAMTYRELNQTSLPGVQFDKVRSESSEDMDRIVDDLINARLSTMATQVDSLPRPLLFNFRDHDRYGQSNGLVSIFDYSGEVLQRMTLNDPQRRRALDADGYLFFLDPTQRSEEQVKELLDFREDVRVLRNVRSGQALRAPVALCVSKIDLLVNQDYSDAGASGPIGRFYQELEEIDPTGTGMSLEIMERRSEAIARLRDTIWPGWQVEKQIHELFGGRCLFFPLTPVGLTELGVEDLGQRTIQPFGILDPLMWLLHMNGYKVLGSR
ncbi:MAG: hypothetical protein U0939_00920 [Pirellulales bacterium]